MRRPPFATLEFLLPALAPSAAIVALMLFAGGKGATNEARSEITPAAMEADQSALRVPPRARATPDAEAKAAARTAEIATNMRVASPFFSVPSASQSDPAEPAPVAAHALNAHLTALMNTPRGAIAVIDGRPCRAGDRIADAATIGEIDVEGRTVTVSLDNGKTIVLTLSLPGGGTR